MLVLLLYFVVPDTRMYVLVVALCTASTAVEVTYRMLRHIYISYHARVVLVDQDRDEEIVRPAFFYSIYTREYLFAREHNVRLHPDMII